MGWAGVHGVCAGLQEKTRVRGDGLRLGKLGRNMLRPYKGIARGALLVFVELVTFAIGHYGYTDADGHGREHQD